MFSNNLGMGIKNMSEKSKLFIASSVEGLKIAESIKAGLEHSSVRAEIWTQGVFKANGYPLQQLEDAMDNYDFGLFVMTPDDIVERRGEEFKVARDNVLLELGMFIGFYGKEYCFILAPRGDTSPKMPSDMTGFQTLDYDPEWAIDNIDASLGTACRNLKIGIEQKVKEDYEAENNQTDVVTKNTEQPLSGDEHAVLDILFQAQKRLSSFMIAHVTETNKNIIDVQLNKLLKKNLVSVSKGHCTIGRICPLYQINPNGTEIYLEYAAEQ